MVKSLYRLSTPVNEATRWNLIWDIKLHPQTKGLYNMKNTRNISRHLGDISPIFPFYWKHAGRMEVQSILTKRNSNVIGSTIDALLPPPHRSRIEASQLETSIKRFVGQILEGFSSVMRNGIFSEAERSEQTFHLENISRILNFSSWLFFANVANRIWSPWFNIWGLFWLHFLRSLNRLRLCLHVLFQVGTHCLSNGRQFWPAVFSSTRAHDVELNIKLPTSVC